MFIDTSVHVGAQTSGEEKNKEVKGPRANNYGVKSNVPPDNPSKCVHMLDVEDLQARFPACCGDRGPLLFCITVCNQTNLGSRAECSGWQGGSGTVPLLCFRQISPLQRRSQQA